MDAKTFQDAINRAVGRILNQFKKRTTKRRGRRTVSKHAGAKTRSPQADKRDKVRRKMADRSRKINRGKLH